MAGTLLIAELALKEREPELRAGTQCRWCPINEECETGAQYLRQINGEEDEEN
ncbi:unannotated protein [freshwater metagenome]|uniref:Unannotated protein n=1 Tax=freshwater metagenome TaxID=449393 RepID=A0A6J6IBZ3_9ZZZZ